MPEPIRLHVTAHTCASPEAVYDLVSDVTRMGEWSPETVDARWLGDATGAVVGARFAGRNRLGFLRWTTKPEVTEADRGRAFAFIVPGPGGPEWRYDLAVDDGGRTVITESVTQRTASPAPLRFLQRLAGVTDRAANLRAGMTTTLERVVAAAETQPVGTAAQAPRPGSTR